MKEKIMQVYNSYLKRYPYLQKHNTILMIEGLGNYKGKATKNTTYHPLGRMGAVFATITGGELHYTTSATTLPDLPMNDGAYNGGTPTPTLKVGIYKVYSTMHHGKEAAMEVGLGNEGVPVVRLSGKPISSGINIHSRPVNDYKNIACSAGCLNVLDVQFSRFLEYLNVTRNGKYQGSGRFIGYLIVDRSCIHSKLQELYKGIYKDCYSEVFNISEKPREQNKIPQWQIDSFNSLIDKGILQTPEYWKEKLGVPITVGELFAVLNKTIRK